MTPKMKKDEFLCKKENKQWFIDLLTGKLEVGVRYIRNMEMQMSSLSK
jgi:hypothetical protein